MFIYKNFFLIIFICFDVIRIGIIRFNLGIVEGRLRELNVCKKGKGYTNDRLWIKVGIEGIEY